MGLSINEVTHGYSRQGAEAFKNDLNHRAITETANLLRDINNLTTTFQRGWQGQAEVNFENKLRTAVTLTADALENLKGILDKEFQAIESSVLEFDNNVIDGM